MKSTTERVRVVAFTGYPTGENRKVEKGKHETPHEEMLQFATSTFRTIHYEHHVGFFALGLLSLESANERP